MKKKVLFVATVVKTHIMQFHVPYLKMFQDMGWETAVAARNDYEDPADCRIPHCDTYFDIPFERVPWKKGNLDACRQLKRIMDTGNYDLIHCHTPVGALLARLAAGNARKQGTKVIYTAHGFHFFRGAPLVNWLCYFPIEWLMSFATDMLITINQEDYARAKKLLHPRHLEYVPGVGIDTQRFCLEREDREEKRRELGFGEKDFLLLTIAELIRRKNHTVVLQALAELKAEPEYAHIHYLIAGRGERLPELQVLAQTLGIADHVHFLGYRRDTPELYRGSDLFAFMPFQEGLPVALMEAMSSGLPAVCSRIRGNTDLVEDGVSGVFAENEPKAVAAAILELYRREDYRAALGRAAAERAKQFGNDNVHRRMKEIYLSL